MGNYTFLETEGNPINLFDGIIEATNGVYPLSIVIGLFIVGYIALTRRGYDPDQILIYLGAFEFIIISLFIIKEWLSYGWIMLPVGILFTGLIMNRLK